MPAARFRPATEVRIAARRSSAPRSSALQTLGRFAITALSLGAVVLFILFERGDASAWWIELLRFAPYPILLAPVLVALGLSLTLGWGWRLLALATLAIVMVPVMGLSWGSPDSGSQPLRVMTYNIKSYRAHDRPDLYGDIAAEIERHDPDLLVMQDADKLVDTHRPRPEALRRALGERHRFEKDQYIVASRHPLRDCQIRPLAPLGDRGDYVRCTVLVGQQPVDLVTVHFLSPREGLNEIRHERLHGLSEWRFNHQQRLGQAHHLANELVRHRLQDAQRLPAPLIVAGDLNAAESSPVVRALLATGLRDAWSSAATGYGYTHGHSLRPHIDLLRIDHILVSSQIGVARTEVGGNEGSEHRPVIADLWLKRD